MLDTLRNRRTLAAAGLQRGVINKPVLKKSGTLKTAFRGSLFFGLVAVIMLYVTAIIFPNVLQYLSPAFDMGSWIYGILLIFLLLFCVKIWRNNGHYTRWEALPFSILLALPLTTLLHMGYMHYFPPVQAANIQMQQLVPQEYVKLFTHPKKPLPIHINPHNGFAVIKHVHPFFVSWVFLSSVLCFLMVWHRVNSPAKHLGKTHQRKKKKSSEKLPFGLWLGKSTGQLAERSHRANIAPSQEVGLFQDDAAQNLLILGGISSGKTTRAIHPALLQLLDQACGGLIFDIKGDFQTAVLTFAEQTNRTITRLGPGFEKMNLLAGLTPEMAASFLKSVFLLGGKSQGNSFWVDTATELCRNTLGLLSFLPANYSLQGLYLYLFDIEERLRVDKALDELMPTLDEKATRLLKTYWNYHERIFDRFDEKVKSDVNATVAQVLSPFNHPELIEAFCSVGEQHVPMEAVLDGAVYLLSLPLSIWGLGGKVVYSMIKLRFYNVMQQRTQHPEWNQTRYVFLLCDEYQEIVSANKDGLSDLNFWDKSRSSKTVGIISAQSVSSFYAAIGDRDITDALLQNFRQKLCFRTEDQHTIRLFTQILGNVEVHRMTQSRNQGSSSGDRNSSTHKGDSTSMAVHEKPLLDGAFFRDLPTNSVLAVLSVQGTGYDDVLQLEPFYVN